jgi:hypothetical protein
MNVPLVLADAKVIAGGFLSGLGELAASPWMLVPLSVALAMGAGIWYLGRRSRRLPLAPLEPEVGDDTLAMLSQPQPAPWPDADTIVADDVPEALRRLLEGDGRG